MLQTWQSIFLVRHPVYHLVHPPLDVQVFRQFLLVQTVQKSRQDQDYLFHLLAQEYLALPSDQGTHHYLWDLHHQEVPYGHHFLLDQGIQILLSVLLVHPQGLQLELDQSVHSVP